MARYSAGVLTGAGSTTLPIASVYATAVVSPRVCEVGITNSTATAVAVKLCLLTTAGTQGAGLTETKHDPISPAATCTAFTTHSSTGPTVVDAGYRTVLPAQIGAGIIWTFGDRGIGVPLGTGNGVGVIVENGTGQACYVYFVWDE